jgi:hypothetical protein
VRTPEAVSTSHRRRREDVGREITKRREYSSPMTTRGCQKRGCRTRGCKGATSYFLDNDGSSLLRIDGGSSLLHGASGSSILHRSLSPSSMVAAPFPWLPPPPAPTTASTRAASTSTVRPPPTPQLHPRWRRNHPAHDLDPASRPRPGGATHLVTRRRPGGRGLGPIVLDLGLGIFLFLKINFLYGSTPAGTKYA